MICMNCVKICHEGRTNIAEKEFSEADNPEQLPLICGLICSPTLPNHWLVCDRFKLTFALYAAAVHVTLGSASAVYYTALSHSAVGAGVGLEASGLLSSLISWPY